MRHVLLKHLKFGVHGDFKHGLYFAIKTLFYTFFLSLQMVKQLDSFKNFLETFAAKHQSDIKKNPEFRQHFQKLCSQIGVDPLACKLSFPGLNLIFKEQ